MRKTHTEIHLRNEPEHGWQRRWRGQRKQTVDTFTDTSKPCCRTWDGLPARTHTTVTRAG